MRSRGRWTAGCVIGCLVSAFGWAAPPALGGSASASAVSARGVSEPGLPLDSLAVPGMQTLDGEQEADAQRARWTSPAAFVARERSRTEFSHLGAARALQVAREAFPEAIERPAGGPPQLPAGDRIDRYITPDAAQLELPGGAHAVIESSGRMAKQSSPRHFTPLDLGLHAVGGGYAPVSSDVPVRIPKRLSSGVQLADTGVSVTPAGAGGAPLGGSTGTLDGAAVLYANTQTDADTLVKPTATGFAIDAVLRSTDSPQRLAFRVGVPSGARLAREAGPVAAAVLDHGRAIATVRAPAAWDAAGTPVPLSVSVAGHTLTLTVAHRSAEYQYPIEVDPEINDKQLATTSAGKPTNWEFKTSSGTESNFAKKTFYENEENQYLETYGVHEYKEGEWAYWGYQTYGDSKIYEFEGETEAKNKEDHIESLVELQDGGVTEEKEVLSSEAKGTAEYARQPLPEPLCPKGKTSCVPTSGGEKNAVHFQQSVVNKPTSKYSFSDFLYEGIVSISEPSGTHSTASYNKTSSELEFEVENEKKEKEKQKRTNALYGSGSWLSKYEGAIEFTATDPGIGVSATKLEYESSAGKWEQISEHNYLEVEHDCKGVQCTSPEHEFWTLNERLPNGEDKVRYRAEDAMPGTKSLESEGTATVKVDDSKPYDLVLNGLPWGNELREGVYELTGEATDGEGSTVPSSGIKSLALSIDGKEVGKAGGTCSVPKGACTASAKWTINGAELGAGHHAIVLEALDNAHNEAREPYEVSIRHSTPVAIGPGSVDLESGDFSLGAGDVSLGSGLNLSRTSSSRDPATGLQGPLGPQWSLSLGSTESLVEMVDGSVLLTAANGAQTIFATLGEGKFEAPPGDSNLQLTLEENKETKQKLAYYLKDAAADTSVKFTLPAGATTWVPTKQEGTVATDTVTYTYHTAEAVNEYPLASGDKPSAIVSGADGELWFNGPTEHSIDEAPTSGTPIAEYSLGSSEKIAEALAEGPDGNVWYTDNGGAHSIGKITPSGKITEYAVSATKSPQGGIVAGSDGNMWFPLSEGGGHNAIAKITTSGTITEYPLSATSEASSITPGPEKESALWYTDYSANKIGKITTSGTITEYPLSSTGPIDITAGPDGNLWFTETLNHKIGKITTSGTVTEYTLSEKSDPYDITAGPEKEKALWFTNSSGAKIGKITTSGTVTEYALPTGSGPEGITAGPDGKLWFAEHGSEKIGTITTSGVLVEPTEALAPVPSGVSCSPELKAGCRALKFVYGTATTAKSETEWGEYRGRLMEVFFDAYNPSTKKIQETPVAEYRYDQLGRLRSEWDPRISPVLKTIYGYDNEGHVTALTPPGEESWAFTYGASTTDAGTGRLLKVTRAPASEALWSNVPVKNTEAPKITGSPVTGTRMAVSNGTWSGSPIAYAYQWSDCNSESAECKPIPGATNANYTPTASDLGHTLIASVTATNGSGSITAASAAIEVKLLATTPEFSEYSLASSTLPTGITVGPDGNLWVAQAEHRASKITTAGSITEYKLSYPFIFPNYITPGPEKENALWFTDRYAHKIGKITTSGSTTEYTLPEYTEPQGITTGPDGKLWFAMEASSGKQIGKITTSGTITEYSLPSGSYPQGIAAGPDGNLWFTDRGTSKIGKITTSGTVTEYSLPKESEPMEITAGPEKENALWFTDMHTTKIGKITTSGTITEYAATGSGPEGIAVGLEGNLWFTEPNSSKIGKITTSGTVTTYSVPGSDPVAITAEPAIEKSMWFTDFSTSKIGKISFAGPVGEARSPNPGWTIDYNVPLEGSSAPQQMGVNAETHKPEPEKWGQTDDPVEATAIFPPDSPQGWPASNYKRATVYYLDAEGHNVNVATPSHGTYGSIAAREYNEENDVTRTLSPDNRATALEAGTKSAEVSKLLDTQYLYNNPECRKETSKPEKETAEFGTRLCETWGPQHQVKYVAGKEHKESLARLHTKYFYEDTAHGAPEGEHHDLVTEATTLALLANEEEVEVHKTTTSYSGQSGLGWKLRAPTSVTDDPEGQDLTHTTVYNEATGQVTETRTPGSNRKEEPVSPPAYSFQFGSEGTGNGQFKEPRGEVVLPNGNMDVVDSSNSRVEEFSATGAYLGTFGKSGKENGQFKSPYGIALDSKGNLWIVDSGNQRVQELNEKHEWKITFGSEGTGAGQFKEPRGIAVTPGGDVYVSDGANNRVEEFNSEGKFLAAFGFGVSNGEAKFEICTTTCQAGILGSGNGQFNAPRAIAIGKGGEVWVADDGNNRVEEFNEKNEYLSKFGKTGTGNGEFKEPKGIALDAKGHVWVADSGNDRVQELTSAGTYLTSVGAKGKGNGQFEEPWGLAFTPTGALYVADVKDARVEEFAPAVFGNAAAHDAQIVYYTPGTEAEVATCRSHPEWAGLTCETRPAAQPEDGLPNLPVTTATYNVWNEPETTTETIGTTTRTKTETYDEAGRATSSETTATADAALPKVTFEYNSSTGALAKKSTTVEGKAQTLTSEYNTLGELTSYKDADGNTAKYKYAAPEGDGLLEEVSDSSNAGASKQTYSYDETTKALTKLVDSAAGTFTASYDAEGKLASEVYPNNMCAEYTYNSAGEATGVRYVKTTNCAETEPVWYSDTRVPSVRGETLSQTSTLASENDSYDTLGRLTEVQETPAGEGCTTRLYAYEEESNRTSLTTVKPGGEGKCQTEGGTVESHSYDTADRMLDAGIAYDKLGNVEKLPAMDAEGHELASTFYVDDAVATQSQNGVTNEYRLDPEGRVRETITGSKKVVSHYDGAGEAVAWTSEEEGKKWTREIPGIDGTLSAVQTNGETPVLQLHDLQGDVVATAADNTSETKLLSTYNSTEFGVPTGGKAPPKYAWLGADDVASELASGVITEGATSYVPQTGRPLAAEEVEPPGLPNGSGGTPDAAQEEPWNMQGAARVGAEAPGLEAGREREAAEAAAGAIKDPMVYDTLNRGKAVATAEKYIAVESIATGLELFDVPGTLLELEGKILGEAAYEEIAAQLDDEMSWYYDASQKLLKCAGNHRGQDLCYFFYDQNEWTPSVFGWHPFGTLKWPNFSVEPRVWECHAVSWPALGCPAEVHIKTEL
jgi:streptogramin lyase